MSRSAKVRDLRSQLALVLLLLLLATGLLLSNRLTDFDQTWSQVAFGDPLLRFEKIDLQVKGQFVFIQGQILRHALISTGFVAYDVA
jgi:hypothetical protein